MDYPFFEKVLNIRKRRQRLKWNETGNHWEIDLRIPASPIILLEGYREEFRFFAQRNAPIPVSVIEPLSRRPNLSMILSWS
jgi:hypothetical protein